MMSASAREAGAQARAHGHLTTQKQVFLSERVSAFDDDENNAV